LNDCYGAFADFAFNRQCSVAKVLEALSHIADAYVLLPVFGELMDIKTNTCVANFDLIAGVALSCGDAQLGNTLLF
jgi:hypothetical protein